MINKTVLMHIEIESDYICNLAREGYNFEENEAWAIKVLREGFEGITEDQIMKILNGDAIITGWSICDDSKCTQCKGKEQSHYVEKEDKKLKMKIQEHKLLLNNTYFKIGQFTISKELVVRYLETAIMHARSDYEYFNDDLEMVRNSFWSTNQHRRPNEHYIPEKTSLDYLFCQQINPFIDELDAIVSSLAPLNKQQIPYLMEKLSSKYAIFKDEELVAKHNPSPVRAEGCILVSVEDPNEKGVIRNYNLPKERYIFYVKQRMNALDKIEFVMNLDKDSAKVKKSLLNLENNVGYAHLEMMKSMNLDHSETGFYPDDTVECYVNALLQWYMYKIVIHDDSKSIEKLPDTLMLNDNRDAYVDGELVQEMIDL